MTLLHKTSLHISVLFYSLFLCAATQAQDSFDAVTIVATKVAGNVYMLTGQGGNIAVSLGPDGVLMVDDQFAPLADKIRAAIKALGGDSPTYLLNTHFHGDHTGGNELFANTATIIAQDNVRLRMVDPENGRVPESLPVITYTDSMSLFFNGEEIKLMHMPAGHTDGDAAIWFTGSKVLHMGDQFFSVRFPFLDLANGGSVAGLISNLDKMLALIPDDVMIIPGHGELANKAEFARYVAGVKDTVGIVTSKMKAGKSAETILAEGLPEKYKDWGTGFISQPAWINTILESSTK